MAPSRPILPARLAVDSAQEVKGFVQALLYARKNATLKQISKALFTDDPMIKGPFVTLSRPYIESMDDVWPLDDRLRSEFVPYAHQIEAYKRLSGESPRQTIITTGTGSGKSECFLLPVLDYVMRCQKEGRKDGVKALIIYPMNALIDDQAERLARLVHKTGVPIRVGRYTGDNGKIKEMSPDNPDQIIDNRDTLCESPPDILLTNYRMLDLMLLRPEEKKIWAGATRDLFRFLVLDEVHTFDGAQGADVSCLIRRLRQKLGKEFTCVGTSATVAGGGTDDPRAIDDGIQKLCGFAGTLFGVEFTPTDVIRESRVPLDQFLRPKQRYEVPSDVSSVPSNALLVEGGKGYEGFVNSVCDNWNAPNDPVERSLWVLAHPLFHRLMESDLRGVPLQEVAASCDISEGLLVEFLDLVATARKKKGDRLLPVLPMSVQLWVAETSFMLRRLAEEPQFRRGTPENSDEEGYLPAVHCRNCGFSGWTANLGEPTANPEDSVTFAANWSTEANLKAFFERRAWILFPVQDAPDDDDEDGPGDDDEGNAVGFRLHYDPVTRLFMSGHDVGSGAADALKVIGVPLPNRPTNGFFVKKKKTLKHRCPDCLAALDLALTSVGGSMLGSVLTSVFLAHGANPDDRKVLIFNDSVQDAAHQAGYMGARGYRFNVRRYFAKVLGELRSKNPAGHLTLEEIRDHVIREVAALWEAAGVEARGRGEGSRGARRRLMQIVPKDLWERWRAQVPTVPFLGRDDFLRQLQDRLAWDLWLEITLNSELGWSLKRAGLAMAQIQPDILTKWAEVARNTAIKTQLGELADAAGFVAGVAHRLIKIGAIYNSDLVGCYAGSRYSIWPLKTAKPHLNGIFHEDAQLPQVLIPVKDSPTGRRAPTAFLTANGRSWFERWTVRSLVAAGSKARPNKTKVAHFLTSFIEALQAHGLGLTNVSPGPAPRLVLNPSILRIIDSRDVMTVCQLCGTVHAWGRGVKISDVMCTQYLCRGKQNALDGAELAENQEFQRHLSSHYSRSSEAIFSHSHTGALEGDDRRVIEAVFKRGMMPGDVIDATGSGGRAKVYSDHPINMLACTPTLEMGIDIGSLSGVVLRGFPRNLSSTIQRVGRSGRTSGNAFNTVLITRRPHDRYHWDRPDEIFKGAVTPPGCEFRTKDILMRQFHAFLLDTYAAECKPRAMPMAQPELRLADSDFWKGLSKYLRTADRVARLTQFMDEVRRGDSQSERKERAKFYPELEAWLATAFDPEDGMWGKILRILNEQDEKVRQLARGAVSDGDADQEVTNNPDANGATGADAVEGNPKIVRARQQPKFSRADYTLTLLADRGVLPNYAFTEEGITLSTWVWRRKGQGESKNDSFTVSVKDQTRPIPNALTELVPGQSFYSDGLKIPVTRIALPSDFDKGKSGERKIVCSACGTISPRGGADATEKEDCPRCFEPEQDVCRMVELKSVFGGGEFDELQIRDQEEDRERGQLQLETFIDYTGVDEHPGQSLQVSWRSSAAGMSFQFRTYAPIQFLVRGEKNVNGEFAYFGVCSQCGAVPHEVQGGRARFSNNGRANRHAFDCQYRDNPDSPDVKVVQVALSRKMHSDAIRFQVIDTAQLPTINALLRLAMRIHLGGSPQHLAIRNSLLKNLAGDRSAVVTLYDTIPGGTGHLRSFMPAVDDSYSSNLGGIRALKSVFEKTKEFLDGCDCEDGCYRCLLSYENQFYHADISKERAKIWMRDFVEADDWAVVDELMGVPVGHDERALEARFIEQMREAGAIPGLEFIQETVEDGRVTLIYNDGPAKDEVKCVYTHRDRVNVAETYTMPDFTFVRDGKVCGYLYTDGRDPHLSPGQAIPGFVRDVYLRNQLLDKIGLRKNGVHPVFTFTTDMVNDWRAARPERRSAPQRHLLDLTVDAGGKRAPRPLLGLCVLEVFGFNRGLFTVPPVAEMLTTLRLAYVQYGLAEIMGTGKHRFYEKERIDAMLKIFASLPGDGWFGGLQFKKLGSGYQFRMYVDLGRRVDNGRIKDVYKQSWELFWILWSVLPPGTVVVADQDAAV